MSIIRVHKHDRYVTIEKTGVEDSRLSFKATGLLAYLLSKPDNWTINFRQLATVKVEGEFAIRQALTELQDTGYLHRHRVQAKNGQWGWEQVLYETPHKTVDKHDRVAVNRTRKTATVTELSGTEKSSVAITAKTNPNCPDCGGQSFNCLRCEQYGRAK